MQFLYLSILRNYRHAIITSNTRLTRIHVLHTNHSIVYSLQIIITINVCDNFRVPPNHALLKTCVQVLHK